MSNVWDFERDVIDPGEPVSSLGRARSQLRVIEAQLRGDSDPNVCPNCDYFATVIHGKHRGNLRAHCNLCGRKSLIGWDYWP